MCRSNIPGRGIVTLLILIATLGYALSMGQGGADPAGKTRISASGRQKPAAEADADYEPIPLDRLVGIAQIIVVGEVSKVADATLTVRVALTLAGEITSSDIEVVPFVPSQFEGASRPAAYQPGQSFLFFLTKDEKHSTPERWRILGIGGEGEMPLQDGFVYFPGRNVDPLPFGSYRVSGVERKIQRFEAQLFYDAVKKYRSCFKWKSGRDARPEPARICDAAAMERYAQASVLHKYLAQLTTQRVPDK